MAVSTKTPPVDANSAQSIAAEVLGEAVRQVTKDMREREAFIEDVTDEAHNLWGNKELVRALRRVADRIEAKQALKPDGGR